MNRSTPAANPLPNRSATHVTGGAIAFVLLIASTAAAEPGNANSRPASGARPATTRTVVDSAVRPAGGAVCRECGPGGCRHGHARHGHHRDCRDGACVPYCPVRPGTFGFYGTQWRRWPGQGVVPVSNVEAATPVKPPKSAVPDADEESFGPKAADLPEPGDAGTDAAESPRQPIAPEPDASPAPAEPRVPAADEKEAPREMPQEPEATSKPAEAEPAPAKPKDDNLFDDSAARKVRRKIPVPSGNASRTPAESAGVRTTSHESTVGGAAGPSKNVPRVAFDPRGEATRIRATR